MDSTKVDAIMSWLTPKHMEDVQAFLGLANFYCQFIQDFSKGVLEFEITISGWLVSPPPNPVKIFLEVT